MPPRTLLSSEQRTRLFSIPTDTADMTRHYVLDVDDLALVRARRRAGNRLGFAVQLCALRHPGRVLDPLEAPPVPTLVFVAKQIGVDPALFGEYARRAETRREHVLELQRLLRLRSFGLADWRACLRVGAESAWATDRGEPIVEAMLAHLRVDRRVPAALDDEAGNVLCGPLQVGVATASPLTSIEKNASSLFGVGSDSQSRG